ncbi:right-handed parallel beta-helix repeat-containing protein [Neorhodopirellula pilleata]|uniref:Right handed beta helix domain-containing protein n=1 Tax=Neorhodopirellula pilleata TaxID=2714738 RepID=A0A5C5ZGG6_9BACT|nr:right-handed parallel beta-helix repeat-containing protein [Neorhodopirellula pilleata]TWT86220.1 hypothetical protein Pla100_61580 [Neorhodopirellula pilleata]
MNRFIQSLSWLILSCLSVTAVAGEYYVSPSGNDSAVGSKLRPWQTIQKAANELGPGDTAHISAGRYSEHVNINVSGTAARPVVFKAIENRKTVLDSGSFFARNQSHFRIEGFRIQNTSGNRAAIEITGDGGFGDIVGNEVTGVHSTAAAIRVGGTMHDFTIEGNHVHHNNTGNQEAIRVHERTRDFNVTNNEVNDNSNIGIDIVGWAQYGKPTNGLVSHNVARNNSTLAPWAANIYVDGANNITVEFNVVSGSEYGFQLGCEPATDESSENILRYNIAYGNTEYGLGIGGCTGGDVHHCQIYNNVFVNNQRAIGFNKNAGHDNLIVNNILYEPSGQSFNFLSQPRNTIIDFNCYFVRYGSTPGRNSVIGNPLFENLPAIKFSLKEVSPCIDVGHTVEGQLIDFVGSSVPVDGNSDGQSFPDIGAFEFAPTTRVKVR